MTPCGMIPARRMEVGMVRRMLVPLVVVFLAGCNRFSEPVPNATRLAQSRWFIGVAVIGLLLASWASWRMARDKRSRNGHRDRRRRQANNRNRN